MYIASFLYNQLFAPTPSRKRYIQEYQAIIEKIEALANSENEPADGNIHVEESYMPDAVFFRYKGKMQMKISQSV